jgi:hypothetical protein
VRDRPAALALAGRLNVPVPRTPVEDARRACAGPAAGATCGNAPPILDRRPAQVGGR